LAFLNALRLQLRKEETWEELKPFLLDSEFQVLGKAANKATILNHRQALRLRELYTSGWIKQPTYIFGLMETVKELFAAQGRCERIKNTPSPRQYAFFTKSFVWIFVWLLPFCAYPAPRVDSPSNLYCFSHDFYRYRTYWKPNGRPLRAKNGRCCDVFHLPKH